MDGTVVPQEMKLAMAMEFKHTLPPVSFSAGCAVTRKWLEDYVQTTIDSLKAQEEDALTKAKAAVLITKGKGTSGKETKNA